MADFSKFKKATRTKVDFTDAGDRGPWNPKYQPEGDYLFKIVAVLDSPTKDGNKPQWIFAFQDVENKSAVYPFRCQLDKAQAWKIRNVFEACGVKVPQKMMNVDPQKVVGKLIGASLEDNEYNGKVKSQIGNVFSAAEFGDDAKDEDPDEADEVEEDDDAEDDEDEEEEPAPKKKTKPAAKKAPAKSSKPKKKPPVDEDEDDEDEVEDGDDEELDVEDL